MEQLVEAIKGNPLASLAFILVMGNTGWEAIENRDGTPQAVAEAQIALLIYRVEQLEEEIDKLESAHQ